MQKDSDDNLALNLSVEVLKRRIPFDVGLVRAQTNGSVEAFIDGLNVLAGRPLFDVAAAQKRLISGAAERAINEHEGLLDLPKELDGWTLCGEGVKPPLDEGEFDILQTQSAKITCEIVEIEGRLTFINAAIDREAKISNPWVAPCVLMLLVVGLSLVTSLGVGSVVATCLTLGLGSILCLGIFQKEMRRYQSENRKIRREMESRKAAKKKWIHELKELHQKNQSLQDTAKKLVESCHPLRPEEAAVFYAKFPELFPEAAKELRR